MQTPWAVKKAWEKVLWMQTRDFLAAYGADHGEAACFKIWLYFSFSYSGSIDNKLNQFPQVQSVLPVTIFERSLSVLTLTHEPSAVFSLLCLAEEGSDRAALVGAWHPARANSLHLLQVLI